MDEKSKYGDGLQGKPDPKAAAPKQAVYSNVSGLSRIMKARYNSLFHRYRERTLELLPLIKSGGKNSYDEFVVKSDAVNKSTGTLRSYYRSLTAAFQINKAYDTGQITMLVCTYRSLHKLDPFNGRNINAKCRNELYGLFAVKKDIKEAVGGNYSIYTPVFAILAE